MVDRQLGDWFAEEATKVITRGTTRLGGHGEPLPLRRIRAAVALTEVAENLLGDAVAAARREGQSWAEVGEALGGITGQAAQKRFGS